MFVDFTMVYGDEVESFGERLILLLMQLLNELFTHHVLNVDSFGEGRCTSLITNIKVHISFAIPYGFQFNSDDAAETVECVNEEVLIRFIKLVSHEIQILDRQCQQF